MIELSLSVLFAVYGQRKRPLAELGAKREHVRGFGGQKSGGVREDTYEGGSSETS